MTSLQVEYSGRTLYNCGTDYYPANYLTNPACVALPPDTLRTQLKLQRSVTEWPWEAVALVRRTDHVHDPYAEPAPLSSALEVTFKRSLPNQARVFLPSY